MNDTSPPREWSPLASNTVIVISRLAIVATLVYLAWMAA